MRVVGPHHDRSRTQSRCVTISTSPAMMNSTCDRASTFPRAPHPERESEGIDAKCGHLVHYEGPVYVCPFLRLFCVYTYCTPHDRANPLMQAPLSAHRPPCPVSLPVAPQMTPLFLSSLPSLSLV